MKNRTIKLSSYSKNFLEANRTLVLFGGGIYGELVAKVINELYGGKISYVVDNKTKELPWSNLPVIRTIDLQKCYKADIVICAAGSFDSAYQDIIKNIDDSCGVFDAIKILEDLQDGILGEKISADNHYIYGNLNLSDLIDKYNYYAGVENGYNNRVYLPYCVLCITTKCSLRCKDCAAFITDYKIREDYSLSYIQQTFGKILNAVDGIQELELMGGEPFLHKDFNNILKWCISQEKIDAVKIITNATVMPQEDTWQLMVDNKVKLVVDDYGGLSTYYHDLILNARKKNVRYEEQKLQTWYSLKPILCKKFDEERRASIFKSCNFRNCVGVTNGKFYHCNVAGHMYNAQLITDNPKDYINLVKVDNALKDDMRGKIREYLSIDSMLACSYCNFSAGVEVPIAEQK